MSHNFESEVIKALEELLKTEANCDVIIYIGEKPNFKEFHAHSILLSCRSDYINKILSVKDIEKKDGKYVIKKPNVTPQAFEIIIKYLYTGHVNINNKTGIEILNIMTASDDLKLNHLTKVVEDYFVQNRYQFLQIDPVGILQIVYCHQIFNNVQNHCLETICSEPGILFNSVKFVNLPAPVLEVILKRDDLNFDEIEVWNNLIKWGLAQEKALNEDVSKWRQEKFNILERILHKFIPLIRFCYISSEDYFNEVRPYEEILSKELREEILKFHMVPGYKPTSSNLLQRCYSVLINQRHITLFANWIDKKNVYNVMNTPYKFDLLYRASRDGTTVAAFHGKCNNKGATIVVAKITNSEQMVGGYNPFSWESPTCHYNIMTTKNNFIFSFTNRMNFQTAKVGYYNGSNGEVYTGPSGRNLPVNGPVFGCGDLYFYNGSCYSSPSLYPKIEGMPTGNFNIEDYEVFQVVKK